MVDPSPARASKLTLFSLLWGCQTLVQLEFASHWLHAGELTGWLVLVAAVATVIRPGVTLGFSSLVAASIVYTVVQLPLVSNHVFFELLVNLTILLVLARAALSRARTRASMPWNRRPETRPPQSQSPTGLVAATSRVTHPASGRDQIFEAFAPVVRGMLVVLYYFAFLAKLNTDFLNPDTSCATSMYAALAQHLPLLPRGAGMDRLVIGATLLVEAALPVLLTFAKTRRLGLLIGLPFHLTLGLVGHQSFSALVYALYALFIMPELSALIGRARGGITRRIGAVRLRHWLRRLRLVAIVTIGLLVWLRSLEPESFSERLVAFRLPDALWGGWSLGLMLLYVVAMRRADLPGNQRGSAFSQRPRLAWAWLALMPGLVVLNGLSPYLGLKTTTAFSMYSNLRTEGGTSNHLLLPAWRLARYQDDLVVILASSHPLLRQHAERGLKLTWFELRRVASHSPAPFWVRYQRGAGEPKLYDARSPESSDGLGQPLPRLERKLLSFRPVDQADRASCQH